MPNVQIILNFIDERLQKNTSLTLNWRKSIMPISLTEIDKFNENYDIIFDTLGLTEDERREVYWAVCELVKNRLEKGRSVK